MHCRINCRIICIVDLAELKKKSPAIIVKKKCKKIIVRGAALMLWRNADFSCHAARRGAPTTARGRVRCAVAISSVYYSASF